MPSAMRILVLALVASTMIVSFPSNAQSMDGECIDKNGDGVDDSTKLACESPQRTQANSLSTEGIAPYLEYQKQVIASQRVGALEEGLFGDAVSLYNGSTTFSIVDIDVRGSNNLPVRLSRRLQIELQPQAAMPYDARFLGVGNWDIDVPYMAATFDVAHGWPTQRCSGTTAPAYSVGAFLRHEIWQGVTIHVPSEPERSLLEVQVSTPKPSSGGPYYWTTSQRDVFDCIPMVSGMTGEGFRMTTSSGERYYFDVAVTRIASTLEKWLPSPLYGGLPYQYLLPRNRVYLLASKIEDRFGNTVSYTYNSAGYPTSITSSDGRQITAVYSAGRLASASTNGRTWLYQYLQAGTDHLTAVVLPDASKWQYVYAGSLLPSVEPYGLPALPYCQGIPLLMNASFSLVATHPAGAVGTFAFENRRHYRSGVHANECVPDTIYPDTTYSLLVPNYFDVMSIESKSITGPGQIAGTAWTYSYDYMIEALWGTYGTSFSYPCNTCTTEKATEVTQPDGSKIRHRFGKLYQVNDGRELGTEVLSSGGGMPIRTTSHEYLSESAAPLQAFYGLYGAIIDMTDPSTARVRPLVRRTTLQEGRTFKWEVGTGCSGTYCFDQYARPTKVVKSSSP